MYVKPAIFYYKSFAKGENMTLVTHDEAYKMMLNNEIKATIVHMASAPQFSYTYPPTSAPIPAPTPLNAMFSNP